MLASPARGARLGSAPVILRCHHSRARVIHATPLVLVSGPACVARCCPPVCLRRLCRLCGRNSHPSNPLPQRFCNFTPILVRLRFVHVPQTGAAGSRAGFPRNICRALPPKEAATRVQTQGREWQRALSVLELLSTRLLLMTCRFFSRSSTDRPQDGSGSWLGNCHLPMLTNIFTVIAMARHECST